MHVRPTLVLCAAAALVFAASGCSISMSISKSTEWSSDSSESSSDSSRSSSGSSSPDDDTDTAVIEYQDDVREHTAAFANSGGEPEQLLASLGPVARRHGILDWEADPSSYRAIGEGLAEAGVDDEDFQGFRTTLAGDDELRAKLMNEGYEASR